MRKFIISPRMYNYAPQYDVVDHRQSVKPLEQQKSEGHYPPSGGPIIGTFYQERDAQEYVDFKNKQLNKSFIKRIFNID